MSDLNMEEVTELSVAPILERAEVQAESEYVDSNEVLAKYTK